MKISFIFIAIFTCGCSARTALEMWQSNLANSLAFVCDEPQRRAFKADALLEGKVESFANVRPHTAVLYRCDDQSGYCNNGFDSCAPVETEEIKLVFWVHSKGQKPRYVIYEGENHKKCGCKQQATRIK